MRGDAVGKQISCPASKKKKKVWDQLWSPKHSRGLLLKTCSSYHAIILEEALLVCILDLNPQGFNTIATCALKVQKGCIFEEMLPKWQTACPLCVPMCM